MLKKTIKNNTWWEETINTPPTEIIEENICLDENFIKNKEVIRIDMNIIQFPIFSKNTKRKVNQIVKYFFNKNKDTYIIVTPNAGDYIPGEREEKIFICLMQLMKEKGMAKKFLVSSTELKNRAKISTARYNSIISETLSRLAKTSYVFKNTLYSNELKGVLDRKIETSIFNITTISLNEKGNELYRNKFSDKRIKVIYEIEFSDHFYKNIIQKGYMVYNGNTLLEIESSTARTIYMLVEKLRFDNLHLKLDTIFLIKRIPLKFDKQNLSQTIKTLEKAFRELVNKNLILDFKVLKESTWEKSEIEIFFNEKSNEDKLERFYDDRNDLRKMLSDLTISNTEHDVVDEIETIKPNLVIKKEMIDKILCLMPSKARELKTMPKTIKEAMEAYGYEKVEKTAIYMKKNKVEKVRNYFLKALKNNWVEDEEIITPKINKIAIKEKQFDFNMTTPQYNENLYIEFEKLEVKIKNEIETCAYKEYVKICGMDSKIQKIAFAGSRKKNICEFLEKYPEILGNLKENKIEKKEEKEIFLINMDEIVEIIENTIALANIVNKYEEEEKHKILIIIVKELTPLVQETKLTMKILKDILKTYTGF